MNAEVKRDVGKASLERDTAFEAAARILATLAIEGIVFSPKEIDGLLKEDFNLGPKLRKELTKIFGKNGDGKKPC